MKRRIGKNAKVIIDCDPGIDDTLALLYALASPELDVQAITVVCGNVLWRLAWKMFLNVWKKLIA